MDRRPFLAKRGWGFAPVYVGQQDSGPGSHHMTANQGEVDGDNACLLAKAAGFPTATVIYLDLETGGAISQASAAYLKAWADVVAALDYVPGVYCSHTSVASIQVLGIDLQFWVFRVLNSDVAVEKVSPFKDDDPDDAGLGDAVAWQWAQNCQIDTEAGLLQVDLDTASTRDPSRV